MVIKKAKDFISFNFAVIQFPFYEIFGIATP